MKRVFSFLVVLLLAGSAHAKQKPNFILLLTDDQSDHLGMSGQRTMSNANGSYFGRLDSLLINFRCAGQRDPKAPVSP